MYQSILSHITTKKNIAGETMRKPNKLWMDNRKNDNGVSIFILLYETRFWYVCTMLINANFLFVHSNIWEFCFFFFGKSKKINRVIHFFICFVAVFFSYHTSHHTDILSNRIELATLRLRIRCFFLLLFLTPHPMKFPIGWLCSRTSFRIKCMKEEIKQKIAKQSVNKWATCFYCILDLSYKYQTPHTEYFKDYFVFISIY